MVNKLCIPITTVLQAPITCVIPIGIIPAAISHDLFEENILQLNPFNSITFSTLARTESIVLISFKTKELLQSTSLDSSSSVISQPLYCAISNFKILPKCKK